MRSRNNSGAMKYNKRRRPSIVVSILSLPGYSELPTQHVISGQDLSEERKSDDRQLEYIRPLYWLFTINKIAEGIYCDNLNLKNNI